MGVENKPAHSVARTQGDEKVTVTYTNFGGRVVAENRNGVKRGYVHDPQGNTTALVDEDGQITDTWEYSAFGEVESHTGSSPTPFTWNGAHGYYTDPTGLTYVRARYYNAPNGQWQTMDPLWPNEPAYSYVGGNPITRSDPTGMQDPMREWGNKVFPPGEGIPNWILPDNSRYRCVENWNPATWGYGNCCGLNRRCNSASKTWDCLDAACREHDVCLAGPVEFGNPFTQFKCNSKFCNDIHYCYNQHCKGPKVDRKQCQALFEAGKFYCALVGRSGPPSVP